MRRCARLTCCTAFGRTHRSWCLFVWLFTSGMRSIGGFRRFDVEQLKRPGHLRSRSDRSRGKPESALAHSASHQDEIHYEHSREQVSKPSDIASATADMTEHRNPCDRQSDCLE